MQPLVKPVCAWILRDCDEDDTWHSFFKLTHRTASLDSQSVHRGGSSTREDKEIKKLRGSLQDGMTESVEQPLQRLIPAKGVAGTPG
ncbi:hypothetical protein TNCV_3303181 [Trichonephila clavipes]|nr:hypothetical protein TNCV_3303181 [Trichonephila clavipes]